MGQTATVDAAGTTSVGRERQHNEDQFLIADLARAIRIRASTVYGGKPAWLPTKGQGTLLVVADGMGGLGGGDKASMIAVRTVARHLANVMPWGEETGADSERSAETPEEDDGGRKSIPQVRRRLESALHHGAEAIVAAAKGTKNPSMGTTLTAAFMRFPTLYVAHVGDSRGYLLRGDKLYQLTHDHTMAERLRTEIGARIDPDSPWNHVLWNALGGGIEAELAPEVQRLDLEIGDSILLCSDGLTKHVGDESIARVLAESQDAQSACDTLVDAANAAGGTDNITVVIGRCRPAD
ncbi:MAG TPA: serine/threonine-protein phosphatase [Polyangiaceae bacterium]|nr:serine/threonine-protein phosphatase [Polyangiaceae bacterium]